MQKVSIITLSLFVITLANCVSFKEHCRKDKGTNNISTLVQESLNVNPQMVIGISVVRVNDKKTLYAHNEKMLFTPASTVKVLTAAATLSTLGEGFRFETRIMSDARRGPILKNLYLVGSGDPTFSSSDVLQLVNELKQLGIRKIEGDIVLDGTIFDEEKYPKGWMLSDLSKGYSAPITGLSIDGNRIRLKAQGSKNEYPDILTIPSPGYFGLSFEQNPTGKPFEILLDSKMGVRKKDLIQVKSSPLSDALSLDKSVAVADPEELLGFILSNALKGHNIGFTGKIIRGTAPTPASLIVSHTSKSLSEILIDAMKYSDNHIMESILKRMGVAEGAAGSFERGVSTLKSVLEKNWGQSFQSMTIVDGSGLSRYNQLSPHFFTKALLPLAQDLNVGVNLLASLPVRKIGASLLRAKSGSMSGVKNLVGFAKLEGELAAFAIMTGGSSQDPKPQAELIDKILQSFE